MFTDVQSATFAQLAALIHCHVHSGHFQIVQGGSCAWPAHKATSVLACGMRVSLAGFTSAQQDTIAQIQAQALNHVQQAHTTASRV